jgi:hypothetical protein
MRPNAILIRYAVIAVAILAPAGSAPSSDQPPARHLVDLTAGNTLVVLFDAGLRPTHVPGLESRTCEIDRSDLTIRLPNGNEFEIDVERASFAVLADNELGDARIFGVDEPVAAAVARVKAIAVAMGLSDDGLDEITENLGSVIDPNKRWHRARRIENLTVGVTFYPMFYRRGVEAQTWVQLIWRRAPGTYRFLTEPIQPPPGYEHISMVPTPFPGRRREETGIPTATATRVGTPGRPQGTATSPAIRSPGPDRSPTPTPSSALPTPRLPEDDGTRRTWPWLATIALLAMGIALALAVWMRSRSGRHHDAGRD